MSVSIFGGRSATGIAVKASMRCIQFVPVALGRLWMPRWNAVGVSAGPTGTVHSSDTGICRAAAKARSSIGALMSSWSVIDTIAGIWSLSSICARSRSNASFGVSGGVQ